MLLVNLQRFAWVALVGVVARSIKETLSLGRSRLINTRGRGGEGGGGGHNCGSVNNARTNLHSLLDRHPEDVETFVILANFCIENIPSDLTYSMGLLLGLY